MRNVLLKKSFRRLWSDESSQLSSNNAASAFFFLLAIPEENPEEDHGRDREVCEVVYEEVSGFIFTNCSET